MKLEIPVFFFKANEAYFEVKNKMFEIVRTEHFTEHHMDFRAIFLRHDRRIVDGDIISAFIEPQINMTASIREKCFMSKLQITCLKYTHFSEGKLIQLSPFSQEMTLPDFVNGISPCESWKELLDKFAPVDVKL